MLNNLHRGFLSIEDASFNNLGFIKSGPDWKTVKQLTGIKLCDHGISSKK
jgi:hypothetical protein